MTQIPVEIPGTVSGSGGSRRFGDLRGVQWRVDLGILPSSPSSSIDDLRRVTANSRRRYAALRRQLLVDPHVPKDGSNSPDLVMDNPLSQNPDSMWGRFFKNAELERMVDQDLARLYPERGSYFQTGECQGMLRRMLLLWCLRHPEYGYRQGMHELLAPLLYVLHVDVERLSEVRKAHEDQFADKFDGFSFHENDLTYKFDFKKFSESSENWNGFEKDSAKSSSLSELDPEIQTLMLLTDAYGAEGELGIVISEKFMEHDAYSMFDALMNGAGGAVAMAEVFSPLPFNSSNTGIPPVIEASGALYHLLSIVDSSLHSHLVELGVEPQYFALRWLRVLFGREFSLEDLLVIWDEIFSHENTKFNKPTETDFVDSYSGVLCSCRGAFISAFAVSMMLNLRSSLLATENATACLKRLLNFSDTVNLLKLIKKAKSLQELAVEANKSNSLIIHSGLYDSRKSTNHRGHSVSLDMAASPSTPLNMVRESYWEERWRVLHKEEEQKQDSVEKQVPYRKNGWSEKVRVRLSRTESDPSPAKKVERTKIPKPSVRRSLLEDLERQLGLDEAKETEACTKTIYHDPVEVNGLGDLNENDLSNDSSDVRSEDASSIFSSPPSPTHESNVQEIESGSSVTSNSAMDIVQYNDSASFENDQESSPLPISDLLDGLSAKGTPNEDSTGKSALPISDLLDGLSAKGTADEDSTGKSATSMERKPISGKFQWLWKFGRTASEGTSEKKSTLEDAKTSNGGDNENNVAGLSTADACHGSSRKSKAETVDQNVMVSLRNLGQSMLENIQVIESILPQDQRGQMGSLDNFSKNGLVGKGQVTAMAALKELRKISNLLSEM